MPVVGERDDGGGLESRQQALELVQLRGRSVHHQVLPAAGSDHGAEHRVDRGEVVGSLPVGGRVCDEDGLGREDVADLP